MRIQTLVVSVLAVGSTSWPAPSYAAEATCAGETATIVGTSGSDHLSGTPGRDVVQLGDGHDSFFGGGGDDVICGGAGDDEIGGGAGPDQVHGGPGDDILLGGSGSDLLRDKEGFNLLWMDAGNDHVVTLPGHGTATFEDATQGVFVNLPAGEAHGMGYDVLVGVTSVTGTRYTDTFRGTDADEFYLSDGDGQDDVMTGAGDDTVRLHTGHISTGAGEDTVRVDGPVDARLGPGDDQAFVRGTGTQVILGSGGNDLVVARGWGTPTFRGGDGKDTIDFHLKRAAAEIDLAAHTGDVRAWSVEQVGGSPYADVLLGSGLEDILLGGAGPDVLRGRGGPDLLIGMEGADHLVGGDGDDALLGGGGTDTLEGGPGTDSCEGEVLSSC